MKVVGIEAVPKRQRGNNSAVKEPIFPKYLDESINALKESLLEARGRFNLTSGDFDPEQKAYGAPNWRVTAGNQNENRGEIVEVFWKVGRRSKVALFDTDSGGMVDTMRVKQGDVENLLTQMLATLENSNFKKSAEGKVFHKAAIKAAMPTVNRAAYEYKEASDMYEKKK